MLEWDLPQKHFLSCFRVLAFLMHGTIDATAPTEYDARFLVLLKSFLAFRVTLRPTFLAFRPCFLAFLPDFRLLLTNTHL